MQKALERISKAIEYSAEGLKAAFASEVAFKQEVIAFAILFPLSLFFKVTLAGHAMLIASLFLVLIVEIINSAIEAIVDRISLEQHELSKKAKDMGSAAVFLAILNMIIVWIVIIL